jgi:large repetitive protein
MRKLAILACISLVTLGGAARFTSASFTAATSVGSNSLTVDQLSNYFSVTPISSAASGNVDNLSLSFGTVASARTLTNVFRVTNVSNSTQTAVFTLASVPQISSVVFASSGSSSATLAAGASTTVSVTTSNTVCGHGSGTLKLGLSGVSWMYRTYGVTIDEAPEAPGTPTVTQKPAGRLDVAWAASTTTTNLAGYDLYRSANGGASYTKLNSSPLTGLTYSDTATTDGTSYIYKVQALSTDSPALTSLFSGTATGVADATAPTQPTAVSLTNGGGAGNAYINSGNASSLSFSVTLASGWLSTDTVTLTVQSGASIVTRTASPSSGTVTFTGVNVSSFGEGTVSVSATSTDAAGNVSGARSASYVKDTVAPGAPTASYVDKNNATADQITGTAEANASISITETVPGAGSFSGSASAAGSYTVNVAAVAGSAGHPIAVAYSVRATDVAGNTSGATPVSLNDTK